MADQLKDLEYVESYNYTLSVGVSSEDINPVEMTSQTTQETPRMGNEMTKMPDDNDFTIVGDTTMAHLSEFENENYVLSCLLYTSRCV